MKRSGTFVFRAALTAVGLLVSCTQGSQEAAPGSPLPGLTAEELQRFEEGRTLFARMFSPEEGLGPIYNENTCNACHSIPDVGGGGEEPDTHATRFTEPDQCDLLGEQGGIMVRKRVAPELAEAWGLERETTPSAATARGRFTPPPLFGIGLVEAIPDATIEALADPDDADGDGISGRVGRLADGRLARFRRKADVATLAEVAEAAVRLELGLTTPLHPEEELHQGQPIPAHFDLAPEPEIDLQPILRIADYLRMLAPPSRREPVEPADRRLADKGERIFADIGCATCHVPALKTGPNDVAALDRKTVNLYSDLLLHDMGEDLADVCGPVATPSEVRTEMLMGLRYRQRYLHDGRARTLRDVIALHGGESAASREAFDRLGPKAQEALLLFLSTL